MAVSGLTPARISPVMAPGRLIRPTVLVESMEGISAVRSAACRLGGERLSRGLAEAQAGLDGGAGGGGFLAQPGQGHGGGGHGAGDDHAADRDDDACLGADHAEGEQSADGRAGGGGDRGGGDRQRAREAAGATGGDLPGDQHHDGQPSGGAGQAGVLEDQEQDRADGGELDTGAAGGDGDLAGQVQALPPGDGHRGGDQGQGGSDTGPGRYGGVHVCSLRSAVLGAGPVLVSRPARSSRIRAAIRRVSAVSWLTSTMVPPSAVNDVASCSTARALAASRAEVGSSRSSTWGAAASARARHSRWASPPDSPALPRASMAGGRLTCSSSLTAWSSPRPGCPARSSSRTWPVSRTGAWATRATRRRSASTSRSGSARPSRHTRPASGSSSRFSSRSSVVLPAPDGPVTAVHAPAGIWQVTWSRSSVPPRRTVTCSSANSTGSPDVIPVLSPPRL